MRKVYIIFLSSYCMSLYGQLFTGGPGDGFSTEALISKDVVYKGGSGPGYSLVMLEDDLSNYIGGVADGYSRMDVLDSGGLFIGGTGDGYSLFSLIDLGEYFTGGIGDGYHLLSLNDANGNFIGGIADGYAKEDLWYYLKWVGTVGSDWNVAGNWSNGIIPDETIRVCIPADALTMPVIDTGNFIIGNDTSGKYRCKSLWIQANADLLTTVNCFVTNKSDILIDGVFRFKNPNIHAISNEGEIRIRKGGKFITDY